MAWKPTRACDRNDQGGGTGTLIQSLMFVFCVLFGLAMIANTQVAGDGGWYWYATLLLSGKHLYHDLHLALQPLFVLETAWFLALLGKGWLVSKVAAALHVVTYCIGLLLLARQSKLSDAGKAVVLGCAFFVSIDFVAYRFDDYHVLSDCFLVYSLTVLLVLEKTPEGVRRECLAAGLGILSGLCIANRLNDGAALFVGVGIAIVFMLRSRRLQSLTPFCLAAALTVVLVVHLTGDSLHDWAADSIFKAAASKGGTGSVLVYPVELPYNTLSFLKDRQNSEFTLYLLGAAGIWGVLVIPFMRTRRRADLWKLAAGVALILIPLHHFYRRGGFEDQHLIVDLSAVGVFVLYGLGVAVFVRAVLSKFSSRWMQEWNQREILLLIPLGLLASGSMSSAGTHLGLYCPLAIMILLLPIAFPVWFDREWSRGFILATAFILALHCAVFKYRTPYLWHTYRSRTMFVDRQWYRHPDYGPMVIEPQLLHFIQPICAAAKSGAGHNELLSLPYPYANYFCSIAPWHGYVQTFFDTSSSATIFALMDELDTSPPKWIVYQRQLQVLRMHELVYNQGKPLPQRYLDELIERKLASGAWRCVYTSTYGTYPGLSDEWILIQTRP